MSNLENKIIDAREAIFLKDPYLGYILQNIKIELVKDMETAATDGKNIFVGIDFLDRLDGDELIFILLHELLHILLKHMDRRNKRSQLIYNIACDIVINDTLSYYNYEYGNLKPLLGAQFKVNGVDRTSEQIYYILYPKLKDLPEIDIIGRGEPLDSHELWGDAEPIILDEILENAKQYGKSSIIKDVIYKQIDKIKISSWQDDLKKFLSQQNNNYTYRRTDTRIKDVILPKYFEDESVLKNIWFVLDVSSSMRPHATKIFSEIMGITEKYQLTKCKISFFSNIVTNPISIKNKKEFQAALKRIKSTGGTEFDIIFNSLKVYFKEKPKLIVILTDGYAVYPEKRFVPRIPIFWIMTSNEVQAPYGKNYYI